MHILGVPELKSLCNFRLEIEDINNYPPQFDPSNYVAFVERNYDFVLYPSSAIIQVVAVDLDQEGTPNAQIEFEFVPPDLTLFSINKQTGEISVTGILTNVSDLVSFSCVLLKHVKVLGELGLS